MSTIQVRLKGILPLPSDERVDYALKDAMRKVFIAPADLPQELPYVSSHDLWSSTNVGGEPCAHSGDVKSAPSTPFAYLGEGSRTITREILITQVKRRTCEVLKGIRWDEKEALKVFFPSTSANYICSRSGGGCVGAMYDDDDIKEILNYYLLEGESIPEVKILLNLEAIYPSSLLPGQLLLAEPDSIVWDDKEVQCSFVRLYFKCLEKAMDEENLIEPIGLKEALKVRIITKSQPFRMFVLKPLQKMVHNYMRKHPTFELIGEPVSIELLDKVFGPFMEEFDQHGDLLFQSGDYTDATNCLSSILSANCADSIAESLGLGPKMHKLLVDSLVCHYYDKTFKTVEGEYKIRYGQKNGQLMGSVTSFIVLCLVNAAICGYALEERYVCSKLKDLPLMINGDDCLFLANDDVNEMWSVCGRMSGLEPSIGKVFRSRELLQINSQNFKVTDKYVRYRSENWDSDIPSLEPYYSRFYRIPSCLMRVVEGHPRSTTDDDVGYYALASLRARQDFLLEEAPVELRQKLNSYFWKLNMSLIKDSGLPWYVPVNLGVLSFYLRILRKNPRYHPSIKRYVER